MSIYDGLLRGELADVRPAVLHLLRNHPGGGSPTALLDVVDDYLRLDPDDAEVREARDGLRRHHPGDGW